MPFAQRLKGRLWRKLFKEVVESSQPSVGQKWNKPGGPNWRKDPKLESRALNLNITSVILHNTLQLFASLRRKMAARPFLPFAMCNKTWLCPIIFLSYGKIYRKAASLEVMPAQSIWATSRHATKFLQT